LAGKQTQSVIVVVREAKNCEKKWKKWKKMEKTACFLRFLAIFGAKKAGFWPLQPYGCRRTRGGDAAQFLSAPRLFCYVKQHVVRMVGERRRRRDSSRMFHVKQNKNKI
jgi:hypothetical protein